MVLPILFAVAEPTAFGWFDGTIPFLALPFLAAAVLAALVAVYGFARGSMLAGIGASLIAMATLAIAAYPFGMARLEAINLSRRLAATAASAGCEAPVIATLRYKEPSLVLLTQTNTVMLTSQDQYVPHLQQPGCRIALIDQQDEAAVLAAAATINLPLALVGRVAGFNINRGIQPKQRIDIGVYIKR